MKAADVMADVVADIVAAIEAGAETWSMPWRTLAATGIPTNAVTGNRYTGGNVLTLACSAQRHGYPSARWATYKQWASAGAQVRRGERGSHAFYWHVHPGDTITEIDSDTGETVELQSSDRVAWARAFSVFNAAQVDNDPNPEASTAPAGDPLKRIAHAEVFFGAIPATIEWGSGAPSYNIAGDRVVMPDFDAFDSAELAYATLAHELGHWTGHPSRLNRTYGKRFGDHAYAAEELVADLSAAFTGTLLGIGTAARHDHASYLAHWCQMLSAQPSILWSVASKAQAATDHLVSHQPAEADAA